MLAPVPDVTQKLLAWRSGRQDALNELLPLVYDELRKLARHHLRRRAIEDTLQSGALVHEAYLRMADQKRVEWRDRAHFFGLASNLCGANARCHAQSGKPAEHSSRYATR